MPELPEVQTTVNGLNKAIQGRRIVRIASTYRSQAYVYKDEIKNPKFFNKFKKLTLKQKVLGVERRAKNVLIRLSGGHTIIVHMKMTGHFVYDKPEHPFIRLTFELDNGKTLAFSDMRKFAKVTIAKTEEINKSSHLRHLGPEPLEKSFNLKQFKTRIERRPKGKIKQVLMDQSVIAGIGNIYADEILWRSGVHPLSKASGIPRKNIEFMFKAMKEILKKSIAVGGDSMSDYRNIDGKRGGYQNYHHAYRHTGKACGKQGCKGVISRIMVGARSAHFCPKHQKLYA